MKKTRKIPQSPAPPVTDHPTGVLKPGSVRGLFSLAKGPEPYLLHHSLFHSYKLDELKAELGRNEALIRKNQYEINTESLREQIDLIELLNDAEWGKDRLKWRFEQDDALPSELMYLLAKDGDEVAFDSFERKTYEMFWHLKRMAADGHEEALRSLAKFAIEATEVVNRHAVDKPDIFEPVAKDQVYWPFLKSPHSQLCPVRPESEKILMERIQLGKNTQQDLSTKSRYNPRNAATEVAQRLLNYVKSMRRLPMYLHGKNLPAKPPEGAGMEYLRQWAAHLPEMTQSPRTASEKEWWNLAKAVLLESYPELDPASSAALDKVAPTLLKLSTTNKDPKHRRQRIIYNVERAFKDILAKTPPPAPATTAEILETVKKKHPQIASRHGLNDRKG